MGELNNAKHEMFCKNYIIDLNATQAYLRVYKSVKPSVAGSNACKLLTKPNIQKRIQELANKRSERLEITADTVLQGIFNIANLDIGQAYDEFGNLKPIHEIPLNVRKAMSGIEVEELYDGFGQERRQVGFTKKAKFEAKLAAWRDLGKHLKLFTDKIEISKDSDNMTDKEIALRIAELEAKKK